MNEFRDEDSIRARNEREENRCQNPDTFQLAELLRSTIGEIEHLRAKGYDERRARADAIEGHCEGYELSAASELQLRELVIEVRGVAP